MTPGQRKAARIKAGLAKAGQKVGSGNALICTITRTSGADETTYPPTPGATKDYTATAMQDSYSLRDRDGTQITARDIKVLVSRPVVASDSEEIEPSNGDTLTIGGKTYSVVDVTAEAQGGYAMMWTCQCRSGGS